MLLSASLAVGCAVPSQLAFASEVPMQEETATPAQAANEMLPSDQMSTDVSGGMSDAIAPQAETASQDAVASQATASTVEEVVANMTLDEKISQMIMVAFRTWNEKSVTDLSAAEVADLRAALQKHQYGGAILFGSNVATTLQSGRLVQAIQQNNATAEGFSKHIPYLMGVDEEGGVVMRFGSGTRMTGSMAIGATGAKGEANAKLTGSILGSECAALGFNVDFAPTVDVNSNPANPVIGTRSFGDDPAKVSTLGNAFVAGLAEQKVISTIKHFPGHGDTATDSHSQLDSVNKTIEELRACELVPFKSAIENGADLIMTAHITLPKYDDLHTFWDGSKGYYPATMSKKILTDLLRGELGYTGVVITDALEMGAIGKTKVAPGEPGSVEFAAYVSEECVNAGVDILLIPTDLKDADSVTFYDEYIGLLEREVRNGNIPEARINESVTRILKLKQKYGIFDPAVDAPTFEFDADKAEATVGSETHHAEEMRIAREAITLLKNDNYTLPVSGHDNNFVVVTRDKADNATVVAALEELKTEGVLDENTYVNNLSAGTTSGSEDATCKVTIDYYRDMSDSKNIKVHITDELKAAIAKADTVVGVSVNWGLSALQPTDVQYQGLSTLLEETHGAGGRFVLLSGNLPYDSARYQNADAIMLGYMSTGLGTDPTERDVEGHSLAYNANMRAAIEAMFDHMPPVGTLPVSIPPVKEDGDKIVFDTENTLYERGYGLRYEYAFLQGAGQEHTYGSGAGLDFKNNARYDKLTGVTVDGKDLDASSYDTAKGSTIVGLNAAYLDTLDNGDHSLVAKYEYGADGGATAVATTFKTSGAPKSNGGNNDGGNGSEESGTSEESAKGTTNTATTTKTSTPSTADATPVAAGLVTLVLAIAAFVTSKFLRQ